MDLMSRVRILIAGYIQFIIYVHKVSEVMKKDLDVLFASGMLVSDVGTYRQIPISQKTLISASQRDYYRLPT